MNCRNLRVYALTILVGYAATAAAATKNVILIIGDGMDDQQITIARNYLQGPTGRLTLDSMPVRSSVQVLTLDEQNTNLPLYVAESAGSGTAIATGTVTSRARISTSPGTDQAQKTIVELAQDAGMHTGVVSTASVTDATPAVFMAHINVRSCENPQTMVGERGDCQQYQVQNGGAGSIAEQIAKSGLDLVLGGGYEHFDVPAEGATVTVGAQADEHGYTVIRTTEQLRTIQPNQRVLGLFAQSHLPVRLRGEGGRVAEKPTPSLLNRVYWAFGEVTLPDAMSCEANPDYQDTPPLRLMTEQALAHLDQGDQGFFLMIESASIDKKSHARDACGSIGELEQLEESLVVALAFAANNPDTLVIVTADHSQAAQMVPDPSLFAAFGVPVYTPGSLMRLKMPFGGTMAINYATNEFFAEEHTGAAVPLYANDVGEGLFPIFINQPDIFQVMREFLSL